MESWQLSPHYLKTMHHPTPAWNCCLPNWASPSVSFHPWCVSCVSAQETFLRLTPWVDFECSNLEEIDSCRVSLCCHHVGWRSRKQRCQDKYDAMNQYLQWGQLDREDCVSLHFPFILPYAWISGRDSCLVGVSCHIPSFWCCLVCASCLNSEIWTEGNWKPQNPK